ncbi:hypothetical protein, partial [Enterococcus faecium]|uniref:hypothetical protein n=1 Tax=Enterococcus faecium TaxID=1352 RepID=UPI003F524B8B
VLDHLQSSQERQSGILMAVHPDSGFVWTGGLAIPSLSKPLRVNTRNNLLKLHTTGLLTRRQGAATAMRQGPGKARLSRPRHAAAAAAAAAPR